MSRTKVTDAGGAVFYGSETRTLASFAKYVAWMATDILGVPMKADGYMTPGPHRIRALTYELVDDEKAVAK